MTESSPRVLQKSGIFSSRVIEDIQTKAESGVYRIRGYGTLRERRWATFDDLTFLPCSLTRIPWKDIARSAKREPYWARVSPSSRSSWTSRS